jgi:hypothetical protein
VLKRIPITATGGYVDLNFENSASEIFSGSSFHQHLSLYDAVMIARGGGITARALACTGGNIIAIEIDDAAYCVSAHVCMKKPSS